MSSVVIFIIIALLIKKGMVDGRGFSDMAKVFGSIVTVIFLISLFSHPLMLVLAGAGIIAAIIALVNKFSGSERSNINRAHADEFREMYEDAYKMKLDEIRRNRGAEYERGNMTQRRAIEIAEERMAAEAAAKFVDNRIREKYGDQAVAQQGYSQKLNNPSPAAQQTGAFVTPPVQQARPKKNPTAQVKSAILPKAQGRRTKIVSKFNEQYHLYLTDEQIRNIVAASYMSNAWKQEVEAMYIKYDSAYQWLVGDTAFLRAYLRAFAVQDVTSDFRQQQQIVTDSFQEIFNYSDTISGLTLERRIEMINSKFLTNFDDITYMIAYRYLESLGFHHELETTQINRIDGTFDDLVAKYDNMSTEDVDADLNTIAQDGTVQGGSV